MDNSYLQYQGVNQVIAWYHISILGSFCLLWVTRFPNHRNIPLSKLLPVSHYSFELHHLSSIIFSKSNNPTIIHRSSIIHHCIHQSIIKITIKSLKHRKSNHKSIRQSNQSSSVIKIEHPQSTIKHH